MKIAIDVSQIVYGTGVSVYTKNLVDNLLKIDKDNEYILFGGSLRRKTELKSILNDFKGNKLQRKVFPIPQTLADFVWNRLHILPFEKLVGKMDVFHSSDWTQPRSVAFNVTTIHDLVPIKYPNLSHPKLVSNQNSRFKWIKKEVDRVIVPSLSTQTDVEKTGIEAKKIRIIPEAIDPIFKPAKRGDVEKVKNKYRISGKYLFAVGVNARKNTQRIIEAFEKIKAEINLKLVVVGNSQGDIVKPRGVYFLGHVASGDLPALYTGAEALVYPSLYEGFGLPILEAFACKLPVVTSNIGSMAEIARNAAILVDPYDTPQIVEAVYKVISERDKFVKKGLRRSGDFSWQKTARDTLSVYSESLN